MDASPFATHAVFWARSAAAAATAAYAASSAAPAWAADALPHARTALVLLAMGLADLLARRRRAAAGYRWPGGGGSVTICGVCSAASTLLVLTSANVGALCMLMQAQQLAMVEHADVGAFAAIGLTSLALLRVVHPGSMAAAFAGYGYGPGAELSVLSAREASLLLLAYLVLRRGFGVNKYLLWAAAGAFQAQRGLRPL